MVGFKPVGESTPLYLVVHAVDNLRTIVVEHDDSVKHIVRNLSCAKAHSVVNLSVQVHLRVIGPQFHVSSTLFDF